MFYIQVKQLSNNQQTKTNKKKIEKEHQTMNKRELERLIPIILKIDRQKMIKALQSFKGQKYATMIFNDEALIVQSGIHRPITIKEFNN